MADRQRANRGGLRGGDARPSRRKDALSYNEASVELWTRTIPDSSHARPLNRTALAHFLQGAAILVAKQESSVNHQLITDLASEGGLLRISELIDLDVQEMKPTPEKSIFDEMFWPFLQIITNERVLDSMVLEKVVGDIYAFLYGVQGRRAIKFFGSLLTTLADHTRTPHTIQIDLLLRVNAILVALGSLLEGNQGAAIHEQLHPVIDTLQPYLDMPASAAGTLEEQNAAMAMSRVRRHLDYGGNLPLLPGRVSNPTPAATFELTQDSPGALSKAGARHDNDHANITDIKILPTNEEILSERPEYLPTKDAVKWHVGGIQGLLDQQFRLLREDTVGQLRDSVRTVLEGLRQRRFARSGGTNALRIFKYTNVALADVSCDVRRRCLQITASFDQPEFLRRKARYHRQKWWNECKQLQIDSLVCLVDSDGNSTFFTVAERGGLVKRREEGPSRSGGGRPRMSWQVSPTMNLWANDTRATATLRLIDINNQGFSTIFGRMTTTAHVRQVLVEFPGVLLAAFQHTLEAIQRMSKHGQVPFAPILVPDTALAGDKVVQWPRYTTPPGFFWDLSCLTADHRPLHLTRNQAFNIEALKSQSTLDAAQCKALVAALSRSLALIQGPPGTGKSFVAVQAMKVLLAHKEQARLGPIICVCYTNHALDQFLEHLITDGTGNVIRIGSQSKSEIIEPLNLRYIAQKMARTKTEKQQEFNLRNDLEASGEFVIELFRDISNAGSLRAVTSYLQNHHELHYEDLTTLEDSHGFKVAGKGKDNLSKWLNGHSDLQLSEARTINELSRTPLLEMQNNERHKLYRFWVARIRDGLGERLRTALRRFSNLDNQLNGCIQEVDLRCLQQANVIGVTTSGLARNVNLLARLHSKVLVCEEAGEILEAHTLTAFLPSIEHAILIGDHEQLRPQIQNFDLSLENRSGEQYSLDVSTFERLIRHPTSEIPYETLETQRRMDPSISDLIRRTIYPGLRDHDTVRDYPTIPGVRKRLFWLDHREHEVGKASGDADSALQMSQSNDYEVGLIAAMVSHLVRQGFYGSEDIVVLTPYVRQLQKIRNSLASSFEIVVDDRDAEEINRRGLAETPSNSTGTHKAMLTQTLRVATVDNFQGEEAKVIIVSLVRSNEERRCGFLKTSNRINVLLSRAKHGMYIIGNSDTASSVAMWAQVIEMLKRGGNFGPKLPLCCSQHPDTVIEVSSPDDFVRLSPEGGCSLKCDLRLDCGHACTFKCHSRPRHDAVICQRPCERRHGHCDHACCKNCGADCGKCLEPVGPVELPCGHSKKQVNCYKTLNLKDVPCDAFIGSEAQCGHKVRIKCGTDAMAKDFKCMVTCGSDLPCGHQCKRPCHQCRTWWPDGSCFTEHKGCIAPCGRKFSTCPHSCQKICHGDSPCGLCTQPCSVKCNHTRCGKPCNEPCAPCAIKCDAGCKHQGHCRMPCAIPCDILPCSIRCDKVLKCGHQCPSLCGELCPGVDFCQKCGSKSVKEAVVDYIEGRTYAEIDLDRDPCLFPDCGHVITMQSLDGQMGLSEHYERSTDGLPTGPKSQISAPLSVEAKGCPLCRGSLRNLNRYNRIVKRALLDESTKRFIAWSNAQFVPLTVQLQKAEKDLEVLKEKQVILTKDDNKPEYQHTEIVVAGARELQISILHALPGFASRVGRLIVLRHQIAQFHQRVMVNEQPFGKVSQMTGMVVRVTGHAPNFKFDKTVLQTRSELLASSLLLRCDYDLLADLIYTCSNCNIFTAQLHPWVRKPLKFDLSKNREDCVKLAGSAALKQQPMIFVEAHTLFAKFAALECSAPAYPENVNVIKLMDQAKDHLELARSHIFASPSLNSKIMLAEVDAVEQILKDSSFYKSFYTSVESDEKQAIYNAMAQEFQGTGHWYYCENAHPVSKSMISPNTLPIAYAFEQTTDCRVQHSSPSENAGCRCKPLDAPSAALAWGARSMILSKESLALPI